MILNIFTQSLKLVWTPKLLRILNDLADRIELLPNVEDNFCVLKMFLHHRTSTIRWLIVEHAPKCPC